MTDLAAIKKRIRESGPATKRVKVWLGPDLTLVDEYQRATDELESFDKEGSPNDSLDGGRRAELTERLAQLRQQLDECAIELTIRALSDDEWQRIVEAHPPRRGAEGEEGDPRDAQSGWNMSTFPSALLRFATAAPDLDDEDWQLLLGTDGKPGVLTHPQVQEAASEVVRLSRMPIEIPF